MATAAEILLRSNATLAAAATAGARTTEFSRSRTLRALEALGSSISSIPEKLQAAQAQSEIADVADLLTGATLTGKADELPAALRNLGLKTPQARQAAAKAAGEVFRQQNVLSERRLKREVFDEKKRLESVDSAVEADKVKRDKEASDFILRGMDEPIISGDEPNPISDPSDALGLVRERRLESQGETRNQLARRRLTGQENAAAGKLLSKQIADQQKQAVVAGRAQFAAEALTAANGTLPPLPPPGQRPEGWTREDETVLRSQRRQAMKEIAAKSKPKALPKPSPQAVELNKIAKARLAEVISREKAARGEIKTLSTLGGARTEAENRDLTSLQSELFSIRSEMEDLRDQILDHALSLPTTDPAEQPDAQPEKEEEGLSAEEIEEAKGLFR